LIGRISHGDSFRGCLAYVFAEKKAPVIVGGNMMGASVGELHLQFARYRRRNSRCRNPVFHASLSLPSEEQLSNKRWFIVVREYMSMMEFEHCAFIAVQHHDQPHEHVHIVASRISPTGKVVDDSYERMRSNQIIAEIEKLHGMIRTNHHSSHDNRPKIPRGEAGLLRDEKGSQKLVMLSRIDSALREMAIADSLQPKLFISTMNRFGLDVHLHKKEETITGIAFSLRDHPRPIRCGGGKLRSDLAWSRIKARFSCSIKGNSHKSLSLSQQRELAHSIGGVIKDHRSILITYGNYYGCLIDEVGMIRISGLPAEHAATVMLQAAQKKEWVSAGLRGNDSFRCHASIAFATQAIHVSNPPNEVKDELDAIMAKQLNQGCPALSATPKEIQASNVSDTEAAEGNCSAEATEDMDDFEFDCADDFTL